MSVSSGKYYIFNVGVRKVANLPKNAVNSAVELIFKSNADNQKWFLEKQPDDTYLITSAGYDETIYAYVSKVASGQQVVANSTRIAFKIIPMTTDTYRISAANVAWQADGNIISLQIIDKDNDNQLWKFQPA